MKTFPTEILYFSKLVKVASLSHQLWLLNGVPHRRSENAGASELR